MVCPRESRFTHAGQALENRCAIGTNEEARACPGFSNSTQPYGHSLRTQTLTVRAPPKFGDLRGLAEGLRNAVLDRLGRGGGDLLGERGHFLALLGNRLE